ncbi:syntaxin-binding protein 4-like isoform X2 [Littorina saxatilis]|uniref:syntaxin-binding protein 4-like isoform X2 n=1 Tax=Littorina saxatilis TaxID=31220 RepID=UPI0038B6607D
MSVILTVTDTQHEAVADAELAVNGFDARNGDDEDDEENAREAELVVFDGTTQGLGLKICGGCSVDGRHDVAIFIKRILPGGLAEQQGGLEEGDLLLDVNGQNMEGVTYDRALAILRQASSSNHVEMVITRDEEAREAFMELMSSYASGAGEVNQGKAPSVKQAFNGEHTMNADGFEDVQSHMEGYYKQTLGLRSDEDLPEGFDEENSSQHYFEDSNNSHYSPASSCNSELARHISPPSPQSVSHQGDSQSANLRSLRSVLSHSFPQAFDSVNPSSRFPVGKLEMTLQSLGFVISAEKHIELFRSIPVDSQGLATFDDFVRAVKQVFRDELQTRSSSPHSTPLLSPDSSAVTSPTQMNGFLDDESPLQQENEILRKQIESLKEELQEQKHLCQKAEEQVLTLRRESQAAMEESRSLRTKLRLAEQSQEAARKMEQDYEQVVAMLENEIAHLRLQISKSDGISEQRRLAVAACQLKKSEQGKKTYEVATNKLLGHLQHVQEVLSSDPPVSRSGDLVKGEKKKKKQKMTQTLLLEGQDVIRTVQTLIEQVPLPFGWEENCTADGVRYYINHLNQTTSWTHPSSNVEHRSITTATGPGIAGPPPAVDAGRKPDNMNQHGV